MLNSKSNIEVIHPRPEHFEGIQDLCKRVYPFTKPWSIAQLESHRSYFPGGQLVAIDTETGKVVGLAFSLIILWDDYSPQDNWSDFTSNGFFQNHNPKKGKTLYGAEVMVDPEMRGRGIGKMLYKGRQDLVEKYELKRIRAGARLRGYSKYKDKLTPYEYTVQVAQKKIYDPTLSFQLNQGFVVIDVAKNYLYNDPESLGYAAVIEWLNPKTATPAEVKKQQDSVDSFLNNKKFISEFLPRELHRLVRKTTLLLGEVIKENEGQDFFNQIERYRQTLKKMRAKIDIEKISRLKTFTSKQSPLDQLKTAHAFALQLELINSCETTYRTWRLRKTPVVQGLKNRTDLKFVLTAHPTEARSPVVVELLQRINELLIDGVSNNFVFREQELKSLIRLLWATPLAKKQSPTVLDEAEYLFSHIFSEKVLDFFISEKPSYDLKIRTWVGGDKDGHPGVNAEVMKKCLTLSRGHILKVVSAKVHHIITDIESLNSNVTTKKIKIEPLKDLLKDLSSINQITSGDGNRVKKWIIKVKKFQHSSPMIIKMHHQMLLINQLIDVFPGLVVPIEFREDAGEIEKALKLKNTAIWHMVEDLSKLAGALEITSYVRGFVISHCETAQDMNNACELALIAGKTKNLPIIPLFESKDALINGPKIVKEWIKNKGYLEQVRRHWFGYLEVMLGYSDSAKEIGVFPSRKLIQKSMFEIESTLKSSGVKPIFFHGSGGSVARGGGSIKEQISWWPNSAIEKPKITIQGEMIQRTFSTKEILNSQCVHFTNEATKRRAQKVKLIQSSALDEFAKIIEKKYKSIIDEPKFFSNLLDTTPYRYLNLLKIGSRPAKRVSSELSISSLRAIPWILCWTQTRSLLPTWWGVGTAWKSMSSQQKDDIREQFRDNPFFTSFVKSLGFTLAKVELDIWKLYNQKSVSEDFFKEAEAEYKRAMQFVFDVTGEKQLIWYRPWLEESIRLRAPQIHILNLLQISAMKRSDEALLRETLVGIACGMLTTG
ncbi:MAG: phosphoenolpyruvate carboxylase [Bacteriovoracaceae bacterium]|nr:phosphoenolpyruvate carboxylase [Bacteriovoracaceae bacterium]